MSVTVVFATILLILPVELPDKTLVATLVLATRYRPLPVLAGVGAAFFIQCLISVTAGRLLALLPHRPVVAVVAALFGIGALVLLRGREEPEEVAAARETRRPLSMAGAAFGVLFAAEWGDASQLATAALTARYRDPIGVFVGSFVALVAVAALAVVLGQAVTRRVPLRLVQRAAGLVFVVLALIALSEVIRG